ncbi:gp12 [Caballeronia peredens]|nr:gp12 [Caballeronia peredens]
MTRASPAIGSFNSGELSPRLEGRTDIAKYAAGLKVCENFIPLIQGPAMRRGGFRFLGAVKDQSARTWLVRFEFNTQQAYLLEFGNFYIRFWANHGQVLSGGVPYEIASPYSSGDLIDADGLFSLDFVESADVVYITHQNFAPRKLSRLGPTNWVLSIVQPIGGPFEIENTSPTTVYASGQTGSVTLTASAPIFVPGHVGGLFLLKRKSAAGITQWNQPDLILNGDLRMSDGKTYKAISPDLTPVPRVTGPNKPVHTEGALWDGGDANKALYYTPVGTTTAIDARVGVLWEYEDPGYGVLLITAYASATQVVATVVQLTSASSQAQLPADCVGSGNASSRWAFGSWSNALGWPSSVSLFRQRLVFARKQTVWLSVSGDFENFSPRDLNGLVTTDMAITATLASAQVNDIQWVEPYDSSTEALICGTAGSEFAVQSQTTQQPFGPENISAPPISSFGSRRMKPAHVGRTLLFVQRAGTKLRDISYDIVSSDFVSNDQSMLAEHIPKPQINQIVYQQEPYSVNWATRSDGALVAMTYSREQYPDAPHGGWHRHPIGGGGKVESLAVIPAPDGSRDELWAIINYTIAGQTKRYVCFMDWEHRTGDDPEDSFYLDAGLTLNNVINATLTLSAGAMTPHATNVTFLASSAVWAGSDVGRQIHYRYSAPGADVSGNPITVFRTAKATITAFTSATSVQCRIDAAFPALTSIPANGWRMSVTTISGLSHLEGQTVDLLVDGATHPVRVVSGGQVTLQNPGSKVHVGLASPGRLQTMRLNAGGSDGTSQGKSARINQIVVRLMETLGLQFGSSFSNLDEAQFRAAFDAMDNPPPLFTGDMLFDFESDYDSNPWICLLQPYPLPATIVGIFPQVTTYDRG